MSDVVYMDDKVWAQFPWGTYTAQTPRHTRRGDPARVGGGRVQLLNPTAAHYLLVPCNYRFTTSMWAYWCHDTQLMSLNPH